MKPFKNKRPSTSPQSGRPGSSKNSSPRGVTSRGPVRGQRSEASGAAPAQNFPRSWRLVGGSHAIREALKVHPRQCKVLILRDDFEANEELREMKILAEKLRLQVQLKSRAHIDKTFSSNQGALLYVDGSPELKTGALEKESSIVLILDGLEDPHNLGAVVRTAWLVGVDAIYIPQDRSVGLTPTVHKIASGGAEHVPVITTTDFEGVVRELKENGYWVFGLEGSSAKALYNLKIPQKVCWIVGSEEKGMRKGTQKCCDELVSLPQVAVGASYNASVALGMTLAETQRQLQFS